MLEPMKKSGILDFEKILEIKTEVNLRKEIPAAPPVKPAPLVDYQVPESPELPAVQIKKEEPRLIQKAIDSKRSVLEEFERVFVEPVDAVVELVKVGAQIHPFIKQKPKPRLVIKPKQSSRNLCQNWKIFGPRRKYPRKYQRRFHASPFTTSQSYPMRLPPRLHPPPKKLSFC